MILGSRTKAALETLTFDPNIEQVSNDKVMYIETINDESQTLYGGGEVADTQGYHSWGATAMGLNRFGQVIKDNGNANEVVIATIGYGVCIDNEFFNGRIDENYYNFMEKSKDVSETIAQGSRIAEVIVDSSTENVKLLPLVVVNEEGYTTVTSIIEAIEYAIQKADIICYEMVHSENEEIGLALTNAYKEDVAVCCPTIKVKEEEKEDTEVYPANHATTIAVTSVDKEKDTTTYSGKGDYLDFAASSTDVDEIFQENSTVSKWSGGQYANAYIATSIALIKTYNPEYTILEIYNFIRNYCEDLGEEGKDELYGYGFPNFENINIGDLDKQAPELDEIPVDNENWAKSKNIQIKAKDNVRIWGWQVTENDKMPTEWKNVEELTPEIGLNYEITKNGTYYIWVADSAGSVTYRSIEVQKIDNQGPTINYNLNKDTVENLGYVTITVTAEDNDSGLPEECYSFDNVKWQKENTLQVKQDGTYKVYAKDNLGNVSSKDVEVKCFTITKVTLGEGNIIKEVKSTNKWTGSTNDVYITFNDSLDIIAWQITDSNTLPEAFKETTQENEVPSESNDTTNTNNTINNNTNTNSTNNTNVNNIRVINSSYSRPTYNIAANGSSISQIKVNLQANKPYWIWIKERNGNIMSQSFSVSNAQQ